MRTPGRASWWSVLPAGCAIVQRFSNSTGAMLPIEARSLRWVPPVDQAEGGEFDVVDVAPGTWRGDQFGFVERVDRFGHRVVVVDCECPAFGRVGGGGRRGRGGNVVAGRWLFDPAVLGVVTASPNPAPGDLGAWFVLTHWT